MANRPREAHLQFPVAGLDRSKSYRNQPPFTTPHAVNVRSIGTLEGRGRGGQRPGLTKAYETDLGGTVRMLAQVTHLETVAAEFRHSWFEGFDSALDSTVWSAASWLSSTLPPVADSYGAASEIVPKCGATRADLEMDTGEDYSVSAYIIPYSGAHYGTYYMWLRLDNTTPDPDTDGVEITLNVSGSTGAYTGTVTVDGANSTGFSGTTIGSCTAGWLKAFVDQSEDKVTVYWCGTKVIDAKDISAATSTKSAAGFGMDIGTDANGVCIIDSFYVNGSPATGYTGTPRTTSLLAVANEKLYKSSEIYPGAMDAISLVGSDWSAGAPDIHLNATPHRQKLYIALADANNCQIYNPADDSLNPLDAALTAGTLPAGCDLICVYRDRLMLAKADGWYASRSGDPLDWDYINDAMAAVAGINSDAGQVPDTLTAMFPFSDDYLIFGASNSIWVMRGDPKAGGIIDSLSYEFGVLAGCHGPYGEIYLLTNHGIAVLPPGPNVSVKTLSDKLPRDFMEINPAASQINIAWNPKEWGVNISISPGYSWFYDLRHNAFWEDSVSSDHEAYSAITFKTDEFNMGGMLWGCNDGYIRRFPPKMDTDDGTEISSYVDIGPFRPFENPAGAMLMALTPALATDSGDIDWSLYAGNTNEEAVRAAEEDNARDSGTWSGSGLLATTRPMVSGGSFVLRLANGATRTWAMETITARGRRLLPIKL